MTQPPPRDQNPRPIAPEQAASLLAEIEHAAQLGAFVWYADRAPMWSDGFYRLLGFEPDDPQIVAAHFYERVHPEDLPALAAVWARAIQGEAIGLTYRMVRTDGIVRWVDGRCVPKLDADGTVLHVLGTVEDVTETHAASLRLADAHALLRDTQQAAGVGSQRYHINSGKLEWSEEMYSIVGLDPALPITEALAVRATHPDDAERQLAWWTRVASGEKMAPLRVRTIRPDGVVRFVESHASRVELASGPAVQGISMDVTARVDLEERLHQAAKMEAIGTLAAGIAHDFNNYLSVISTYLDLMARGPGTDVAAAIDGARHAADQCSDFTRQLLTFARKQPAALRQVELAQLVRDASALIRRLLGASIEVAVTVPEHPVAIDADKAQVESALVNLAANARDAMPGGGKLAIELSMVTLAGDDARLESDCAPGAYALIRVVDSGAGIAPDKLPHIFEPYFSTKAVGHGTGLGLFMVYSSVRQHHGMMRAHSVLGEGSSFEMYLPLLVPDHTAAKTATF